MFYLLSKKSFISNVLPSNKFITTISTAVLAFSLSMVAKSDDQAVSFTVSLPDAVGSVRLHSDALGWDEPSRGSSD